ncbi:class I SAM-dependent methyltransferase [Elioraea sp.]|uniref:class I SAM-dependent methyltransferase n=1 Tax=Elioraea sp. TaxID=2185103 RepID=UPI003F6F5689
MDVDREIVAHYGHGSLEDTILAALAKMGKDIARLTVEDLAPVVEFRIGGRQATVEFAAEFIPEPGMRLLDIGSGLGSASRHFAAVHGARVTGIDLTAEYVEVARSLAQRAGMVGRVDYVHGSALDLPFDDGAFDGAYMLHVGMNIADKATLFAAIHRVLKAGGRFGIYDLMRVGDGSITYPTPWASREDTSFVESPETYTRELAAAGFEVGKERDRGAFALDFLQKMRAEAAAKGPPPIGLHTIRGEAAREMSANVFAAIQHGALAPVEIIARAA